MATRTRTNVNGFAMQAPAEYRLRIDVFTPKTIPMKRLAEYMAAFSEMLGVSDRVHFEKLDTGSAVLVARSEIDAAPKIEDRLNGLRTGNTTPDVQKAYDEIDALLRNDNAVGDIQYADKTVVAFEGKKKPKPLIYGPITQVGTIDGQLVSIGGIDRSAHARLDTGERAISGIQMNREMAREMGRLIYGPTLRLHGNGRWTRTENGEWNLDRFTVTSFEILDDTPLSSAVAGLRRVEGNDWKNTDDPEARLHELRYGGRDG